MALPHTGRARRRRLASTVFACAILSTPSAQAAETVESLRYGVSLYHFYQRDYFNALTELMVGQEEQSLATHAGGAELLRGGMALSYGMDREAESIFKSLLDDNEHNVDADQAWFYLGKLAWQRGDADRTRAALARMDEAYEGKLLFEAHYLKANAELALGNGNAAFTHLDALPEDSYWRAYLNYNLGVQAAGFEDWGLAAHHFSEVESDEAYDPETAALKDKSMTARGYTHLAAGDFDLAGDAFRKVTLTGNSASRALLGYGWSHAEGGDYLAALSPWQTLSERSLLEPSARESLLALPYAYGELGRPGLALSGYETAATRYTDELDNVDRAITAFREDNLAELLGLAEENDADWLFSMDTQPGGEHAPYLEHLATRHSFQVAMKELRDLYSLNAHLERSKQKLAVLEEVDAHQQVVWQSIVTGGRRDELAGQHAALAEDSHALRARLEQAIGDASGRRLASSAQNRLRDRVAQAAKLADELDKGEAHRDTLRFYQGLLIFEDSEQYSARAWDARKALAALDELAAESDAALARVDEAVANHTASNFAPRIAALTAEVETESVEVQATLAMAESRVRETAIAELERQSEQLRRALGQSQLAIAQLHDRGNGL